MFGMVLPILVLALGAYAVYRLLHRQPHPVGVTATAGEPATVEHRPFWPATTVGWLGVGALGAQFVFMALVNVLFVPYVAPIVLLAAVVLSAVAYFGLHDRSPSVLIALIVTAMGAVAMALFLAGEIFIGHD